MVLLCMNFLSVSYHLTIRFLHLLMHQKIKKSYPSNTLKNPPISYKNRREWLGFP
jgi:hypothetical protein